MPGLGTELAFENQKKTWSHVNYNTCDGPGQSPSWPESVVSVSCSPGGDSQDASETQRHSQPSHFWKCPLATTPPVENGVGMHLTVRKQKCFLGVLIEEIANYSIGSSTANY